MLITDHQVSEWVLSMETGSLTFGKVAFCHLHIESSTNGCRGKSEFELDLGRDCFLCSDIKSNLPQSDQLG